MTSNPGSNRSLQWCALASSQTQPQNFPRAPCAWNRSIGIVDLQSHTIPPAAVPQLRSDPPAPELQSVWALSPKQYSPAIRCAPPLTSSTVPALVPSCLSYKSRRRESFIQPQSPPTPAVPISFRLFEATTWTPLLHFRYRSHRAPGCPPCSSTATSAAPSLSAPQQSSCGATSSASPSPRSTMRSSSARHLPSPPRAFHCPTPSRSRISRTCAPTRAPPTAPCASCLTTRCPARCVSSLNAAGRHTPGSRGKRRRSKPPPSGRPYFLSALTAPSVCPFSRRRPPPRPRCSPRTGSPCRSARRSSFASAGGDMRSGSTRCSCARSAMGTRRRSRCWTSCATSRSV
ncbi:hypothetical protein FA95DRAFT_251360 [Auriscalpium vulgare]|uniref:Uncharacterized protein n=1 Tax=Auriscalpium vulgare TaxID=40419 RepID=A0ACB8RJY9_9AGAM|nr:hypothetical protein FA95DRAFT_251360 [Auriscalpium vulgare]